MDFRIADTFTDSLAKLTGEEQKQVKTTAFDLQLNPASPGLIFHKLDNAKDKSFWPVRVGSDIRLIVHKGDASLLLCYVDHHDKAYDWADRLLGGDRRGWQQRGPQRHGFRDTECHLRYVACTRVRDHLLVTSVTPASEFLDDLRSQ